MDSVRLDPEDLGNLWHLEAVLPTQRCNLSLASRQVGEQAVEIKIGLDVLELVDGVASLLLRKLGLPALPLRVVVEKLPRRPLMHDDTKRHLERLAAPELTQQELDHPLPHLLSLVELKPPDPKPQKDRRVVGGK